MEQRPTKKKKRNFLFFTSEKKIYTHPLRSSFSFTGVQSRAARQEKRGPKGEGERGKGGTMAGIIVAGLVRSLVVS